MCNNVIASVEKLDKGSFNNILMKSNKDLAIDKNKKIIINNNSKTIVESA